MEYLSKFNWIEHACFCIEVDGKIIYTDPFRITEGARPADIILISHNHPDHNEIESINRIRKSGCVIVAPFASELTGKVLQAGDAAEILGIKVNAIPAYNIDKEFHPKGAGVGYIVRGQEFSFYHAGDTDLIPEMQQATGVTVALLPIGGTFTMDAKEAAQAATLIKPKVVIPMHYNTKFGDYLLGSPDDPRIFTTHVRDDVRVEVKR